MWHPTRSFDNLHLYKCVIFRVNKNCFTWAKKYFSEELEGLEAQKDGHEVSISKIEDLSGDCDLNMRKGKIITIYDMVLKLGFQGIIYENNILLSFYNNDWLLWI